MHLAEQLHAAGVPVFPCQQNKAPAVPKGVDWRMVAGQPPSAVHWPTGLVGVPVPHGVVIIDLDTYKGITRHSAEMALGCELPWGAALIQRTQHGGEHYAFRVPGWEVRQGSDIGITGLDTRIGGKGYICAGDGYAPVGFGVFAFAHPESLPLLPEGTRAALEKVAAAPRQDAQLPEGDRDVDTIKEALAHCDPDCSRSEWVKIGMALRHQFHDDPDTGHALFDQWSSGEIGQRDTPATYSPEDCEFQWNSFKAEGGVTIASLYWAAISGGWLPPRHIDVGAAFGGTVAAPDVYQAMMAKVTERGCDNTATAGLVAEIAALTCNDMQRVVLVATLRRELKEAGILDKGLRELLDKMQQKARPAALPSAPAVVPPVCDFAELAPRSLSRASGDHYCNADLMVREVFGSRLAVDDGVFRWWSGREWQIVNDLDMRYVVICSLGDSGRGKVSDADGTIKSLRDYLRRQNVPECLRDTKVYWRNGALDVANGTFTAHAPLNGNRGSLPHDFGPETAGAPVEWFKFLETLWGGFEDYQGRVELLQEVIGWAMLRTDLNAQKIIALDGSSRGGKGVILDVIRGILGDGVCGTAEFSNMDDGKTQSAFRHYDVMIDSEAKSPPRQGLKKAIGFMNKLTSNEDVSIQLLHTQTPWTGKLNCKFIIACNGIPTMTDDYGATTNRFHVLRFDRSFEGREDRHLGTRLAREYRQIAHWALYGAGRLIQNDGRFSEPESSRASRDDLRDANEPMQEFISEYLEFGPDYRTAATDVWAAYQRYSADVNGKLPGRNTFYRSLRAALTNAPVAWKERLRIDGSDPVRGLEGARVKTAALAAFGGK